MRDRLAEQAAGLVAAGVPPARRVPKGHGHECWLVELEGRQLMVKLSLRGGTNQSMGNLASALRLAEVAGVPSPRLLWSGAAPASLGGRPMVIQEFLPGLDGEEALPGLSGHDRAAYFRDWGAAIARLHALVVPGFSNSIGDAERTAGTWAELVAERLRRLVPANLEAGVVDAARVEAAAAWIEATVATLDVRSSLVHCDLYTPNTLVHQGRFHALLDFEHAKFMDAVYDFVKLELWVFEPFGGAREAFWSGYGQPPPDFAHRFEVSLALELLAGLPYWKKHGEMEMLRDFQRRFDALAF